MNTASITRLLKWLKMESRIMRILFEIIEKHPQSYSQEKFARLYEEHDKERASQIIFDLFDFVLNRDNDRPKWWSIFDSAEYVNVVHFTELISDTDLSNKIEAYILKSNKNLSVK